MWTRIARCVVSSGFAGGSPDSGGVVIYGMVLTLAADGNTGCEASKSPAVSAWSPPARFNASMVRCINAGEVCRQPKHSCVSSIGIASSNAASCGWERSCASMSVCQSFNRGVRPPGGGEASHAQAAARSAGTADVMSSIHAAAVRRGEYQRPVRIPAAAPMPIVHHVHRCMRRFLAIRVRI